MVSIKTFSLQIDADLAKLRLDSFGIKSEVKITDYIFSGALGGYELRVENGQRERALHFIDTYEKELQKNLEEMDFEDQKDVE